MRAESVPQAHPLGRYGPAFKGYVRGSSRRRSPLLHVRCPHRPRSRQFFQMKALGVPVVAAYRRAVVCMFGHRDAGVRPFNAQHTG